jgi:hypothetical protein
MFQPALLLPSNEQEEELVLEVHVANQSVDDDGVVHATRAIKTKNPAPAFFHRVSSHLNVTFYNLLTSEWLGRAERGWRASEGRERRSKPLEPLCERWRRAASASEPF